MVRKVKVNIKARSGNEGSSGFTTFFEDDSAFNRSPDHIVQKNMKDLAFPKPNIDFNFNGERTRKRR